MKMEKNDSKCIEYINKNIMNIKIKGWVVVIICESFLYVWQ